MMVEYEVLGVDERIFEGVGKRRGALLRYIKLSNSLFLSLFTEAY